MATGRYLAMTASEFAGAAHLPQNIGWMACHFSPYGTGLTNLPRFLPPNSLLILNDRIPIGNHDRIQISDQLQQAVETLGCCGILLDIQQTDVDALQDLACHLTSALPCPVAVPPNYGSELSCPIFLPPCPHHTPLKEYIEPWQSREIWLDLAVDAESITLTKDGSMIFPLPLGEIPEGGHQDDRLFCHYSAESGPDFARFTLWRTPEDLEKLAQEAESLGLTMLIGLYQELRCK